MKQGTLEKIQNLAVSLQLVTVEDMRKHSLPQLVTMIANKLNELMNEVHRFETDVIEMVETQNENIQYLLGEGLHLEVATGFENWIEDGTFNTLINQTALKKVNDRIDETNAQLSQLDDHILDIKDLPDNLKLHRLGRKFYPENNGVYNNSQSMCCLDDKIVIQSYQLFEGNDVKMIKMNIETGEELSSNVLRNAYHCNGMCYNVHDGFIYFTQAHDYNESTFFKTVVKVNPSTLSQEDVIDLSLKTKLRYIASIGYDEIGKHFIVNCDNKFEVYDSEWNMVDEFTIQSFYKEARFQTITC